MTENEKTSLQYRFSGYLPPLVSLDGSTDAGYWWKFYTHPYYVNQPSEWRRPIYSFGVPTQSVSGEGFVDKNQENTNQLYPLASICNK